MGGVAVATDTTMTNEIQGEPGLKKKKNTVALLNNQPACSATVNCLTMRRMLLLLLLPLFEYIIIKNIYFKVFYFIPCVHLRGLEILRIVYIEMLKV
jgi:hypothetical protein